MAINKVEFGGTTLIDLTSDTVSSDTLAKGITAHDKSGKIITGELMPTLPEGYATGSVTIASDVKSNASTAICSVTDIGFTPKHFILWFDGYVGTQYYVHHTSYSNFGSKYVRQTATRNKSSWSGSTAATNWTTQTAGYLYFSNNIVYFRSSSSFVMPKGTWKWIATL